jgi:hypothetical protein
MVTSRWLAKFNKDEYHRCKSLQIGHDTFLEYALEVESKNLAVRCWQLNHITFSNGPGPVHTSLTTITHLQQPTTQTAPEKQVHLEGTDALPLQSPLTDYNGKSG